MQFYLTSDALIKSSEKYKKYYIKLTSDSQKTNLRIDISLKGSKY